MHLTSQLMLVNNIVNTVLGSNVGANLFASCDDITCFDLLDVGLDVEVSEEVHEEDGVEIDGGREDVGWLAVGDLVADQDVEEHEGELHLENVCKLLLLVAIVAQGNCFHSQGYNRFMLLHSISHYLEKTLEIRLVLENDYLKVESSFSKWILSKI